MSKKTILPRFVKRAHLWMVHIITIGLDKTETQKMNWFSTKEEAIKFYEDNE
jgi:hypothetical protein